MLQTQQIRVLHRSHFEDPDANISYSPPTKLHTVGSGNIMHDRQPGSITRRSGDYASLHLSQVHPRYDDAYTTDEFLLFVFNVAFADYVDVCIQMWQRVHMLSSGTHAHSRDAMLFLSCRL
jgi:hypothetical protein